MKAIDLLIGVLIISPIVIIWRLAIFFRSRSRWLFIAYVLSGITGLFYPAAFILSILYSDSKVQSGQQNYEIGPLVLPIIIFIQVIIMPVLALFLLMLFNYIYDPTRITKPDSPKIFNGTKELE